MAEPNTDALVKANKADWFEVETGLAAAAGEIQPDPTEFTKKARDLQALRDAVVDAANTGSGLWLSFLFVFFYLAIAAGGVSQRDLFFESPVTLPFLNVALPLLWFFVLGPLLFLIVHSYTLETGQKYYCGGFDTCKWTAKTFAEQLHSFETALPQNTEERDEILNRIARLDPDKKSDWRPDDWELLERRPEPKDYDKKLAAKLRQIGCVAEGAPYVIHAFLGVRLFEQVINSLEVSLDDPAQRADLAKAFLDEAHCPGAKGLSEHDKGILREIRDRDVPAKRDRRSASSNGRNGAIALEAVPRHERPLW